MWNIFKNIFNNLKSNTRTTDIKPHFSKNINENEQILKNNFEQVEDIIYRHITLTDEEGNKLKTVLVYIESLVNKKIINNSILEPLMLSQYQCKTIIKQIPEKGIEKELSRKIINIEDIEYVTDIEKTLNNILSGKSILLVDGTNKTLSFSTEGWKERTIDRPRVERGVRGPQEAFTENINTNIGLLRRKIKHNDLKVESFIKGKYTRTKINVVYLKGVANDKIIKEVKKRISDINVGQINGCTQVQELIDDNPLSIFTTIFETERPDVIAAGLLEGRVGILTDGCPTALMAPKLFVENFISPEDYYNRFWFSFILRTLRFIAFFISTLLPAIYVAILTFHQELIPMTLARTIYASRSGIPFPIAIEMFIFGLFFEAIKEAGTRIPSSLSSSVTIVGALILGQAAISAGFLSADGVIIGSVTGIAIFLSPSIEFNQAVIFLRFLSLFSATIAGFYGITLIVVLVTLHLTALRSFGIPYMSPVAPVMPRDLKDFIIRVPYLLMNTRPKALESKNVDRSGNIPLRKYFFKYRITENGEED